MSLESGNVAASIVLNDMDRSTLAAYGFRSWMLQDISEPYEVILNLFNDQRDLFGALTVGRNPVCVPVLRSYDRPQFFNVSAANNLGLHFSTGDYVVFANADVIHPSNYLRELVGELRRHDICYATGARVNLSSAQTVALGPCGDYSMRHNFDFLADAEHAPRGRAMLGLSPWAILREVAVSVGGFDPRVLVHEDEDIDDRILHFMRRQGLQGCILATASLHSYHLHHGPSAQFSGSAESMAVIEPRRLRLQADPDSTEDIVQTRLDSLPLLEKDLFDTQPPRPRPSAWGLSASASLLSRAMRRLRVTAHTLLRGE